MRQIDPAGLKALLLHPPPGLQLVDVRQPWEYEIVHIGGSVLIPMPDVPRHLKDLDPAHPVVVYCHHGVRSLQVAAFLERSGFTDVANLQGGIDRYAAEAERGLRRY